MSALPPKAEISRTSRHVRYVPKADMVEVGALGAAALKSWSIH
jgi:hypothetical protein